MKRYFQLVAFLLLCLGLLAACRHDDNNAVYYFPSTYSGSFLSWTGSDDSSHYFTLVRVNGRTGEVTTIGGFDYFPAMAYAPDGTLYGISDELHVIDPASGVTSKRGTLQFGGSSILMSGAAFEPDGTLYVVECSTPSRVFTVDLTNGALTYVGTPAALIWDLEFASNGTLFGAFADLFTLNASNMSTVSKIGRTGVYLGPLTFDSGGKLFGLDLSSSHIYRLSLSNGTATSIVAVKSKGLTSLVAEQSASTSGAMFEKAAAVHGFSSPQSLETLMDRENQIKAMHDLNTKAE